MNAVPSDYDSPWKTIIERYFPEFMAFFFPKAHAAIDWTKGYTFLDKELQQVVRDAESGTPTLPSGCSSITIASMTVINVLSPVWRF